MNAIDDGAWHPMNNVSPSAVTLGDGADVVNTGTLNVSSVGDNAAGRIVLVGENVTSSGEMLANAENAEGGIVEIHANDTVMLTEDSLTSARSGGINPSKCCLYFPEQDSKQLVKLTRHGKK